jgi:pimeloyl-ACP methyl ester carboxylesterase
VEEHVRPTRRSHATILATLLAMVTAGCSPSGSPEMTGEAVVTQSAAPLTTGATSTPVDRISGTFDVGGHELYLECEGTAEPTVVYMHGSIDDLDVVPHVNGRPIVDALQGEHRVCAFDRRNTGASDTVDAPQLPEDSIREMRALLQAAGVEPPYVLLGASLGGLLAYLYLNTYPDEVVGAVMLDSMFPDEMSLESMFPLEDRYEAYSEEDEGMGLERISHYKVQMAAQPFIGHEPDIPLTYLASIPQGFDVNDYGRPEYDRKVIEAQQAYVDRFSPGTYVRVDAPHFMEPAIPDQIADAVREVIAQAGY